MACLSPGPPRSRRPQRIPLRPPPPAHRRHDPMPTHACASAAYARCGAAVPCTMDRRGPSSVTSTPSSGRTFWRV
eukprot:11123748-Heterocapsa_arctica.AAC.1